MINFFELNNLNEEFVTLQSFSCSLSRNLENIQNYNVTVLKVNFRMEKHRVHGLRIGIRFGVLLPLE